MSAWSVAEFVAQAPGPVIGSNVAAIVFEPAVGRIVFGAASSMRTSPGASDAQLGAVNGPPEVDAFGHVVVIAVTPWNGTLPTPFT